MKIRLERLDSKAFIYYPKVVRVCLIHEAKSEEIGTCEILKDKEGHHYGQMNLHKEINTELFLYYSHSSSDADMYVFSGIELREIEIVGIPSKKLKQLIAE